MSNDNFGGTTLIMVWIAGSLANMISQYLTYIGKTMLSLIGLKFIKLSSKTQNTDITHILQGPIANSYCLCSDYNYRHDKLSPHGLIVSWRPFYIAYLELRERSSRRDEGEHEDRILYVFCRQSTFFQFMLNFNEEHCFETVDNVSKQQICIKAGNSCYDDEFILINVNRRKLSNNFPSQQLILQSILSDWTTINKNGYNTLTVLICGHKGSGKSEIAYLLQDKIGATICADYNPTFPGYTLKNIHRTVKPSFDNPLIVIINEYDTLLKAVVDNEITPHDNIRLEIKDKKDHNNILDQIHKGDTLQNTILILTTNKQKTWFTSEQCKPCLLENKVKEIINVSCEHSVGDPSLTRECRIHRIYEMFDQVEDLSKIVLEDRFQATPNIKTFPINIQSIDNEFIKTQPLVKKIN